MVKPLLTQQRYHTNLSEYVKELDAIGQADFDVRVAVDELFFAVGAARDAGCSWEAIGSILGVSRQAAQQRFGAE